MFLFKKTVGMLLSPLTVCILFLVCGVFFLLLKKKEKMSKSIIVFGVISLVFISFNIFPDKILGYLEHKYQPLIHIKLISDARWIVVLGGGCKGDLMLDPISRLTSDSLFRVVEGISIHNKIPESKIIFSGGSVFSTISESKAMADVALGLGVNKDKIVEESEGPDTEAQALLIKKIVGNDKFILVTSAFHMPRSMAVFNKAGMHPIAAPAGYLVKKRKNINLLLFFPKSAEIKKMELAVHEYLGLFWAKIRGRI